VIGALQPLPGRSSVSEDPSRRSASGAVVAPR
jgi:hypothetical protein